MDHAPWTRRMIDKKENASKFFWLAKQKDVTEIVGNLCLRSYIFLRFFCAVFLKKSLGFSDFVILNIIPWTRHCWYLCVFQCNLIFWRLQNALIHTNQRKIDLMMVENNNSQHQIFVHSIYSFIQIPLLYTISPLSSFVLGCWISDSNRQRPRGGIWRRAIKSSCGTAAGLTVSMWPECTSTHLRYH